MLFRSGFADLTKPGPLNCNARSHCRGGRIAFLNLDHDSGENVAQRRMELRLALRGQSAGIENAPPPMTSQTDALRIAAIISATETLFALASPPRVAANSLSK